MRDHRIGLDLFSDVLDVLDRHGFTRGDNEHAGRAIFLISDLARIYEGTQDPPYGPSSSQAPSPPPALEPPVPEPGPGPSVPEDDLDAVTLTHAEVRTVLTSLDLAAAWKRDRARRCARCPDQSCFACQLRREDARTYDQMAVRLLHDEQAAPDARSQPGLASSPTPPSQPRPAPPRRKRRASDHPRHDTRRPRNPPPSRRSPGPCPAAGNRGHPRAAGSLRSPVPRLLRPLATTSSRARDRGRPAPRLAARRAPVASRAPGNRTHPPAGTRPGSRTITPTRK